MAKCQFKEETPDEWHCPNCDLWFYTNAPPIRANCEGVSTHSSTRRIKEIPRPPTRSVPIPVHVPEFGPGTELKRILESIGVQSSAGCTCNQHVAQMNIWGIDGCEDPTHFAEIVGWLKNGAWTGLDALGAGFRSIFTGLAFSINPLDPFGSLVRLCIREAKKKKP